MKRPLIPVALLYVFGILLGGFTLPLPWLFILSLGLGITALIWARARPFLLCPLLILFGWTNLARHAAVISPYDVRIVAGEHDLLGTLRGKLRETPHYRVYHHDARETEQTTAQIEITAFRADDQNWQPASGRVIASVRGILPETFFAGQIVEITGVLRPVKGPIAEGLFDYRAFLSREGIYYQLQTESGGDWRIVSSPRAAPLADRFCAWARKALARGLPVEDESLRLEWALTLGWKAAMTEETAEPFIRAATYHIFAVDGLRIAIISGILIGLFRALNVPRVFCGLLAIPLILFYAAMTGWPASAIRAIVMIAVVFAGWALKRPSDLINSLFAAALIILVWEPRELFQAGFQLSFFVVLCIILILPFFEKVRERALKPDPMLPEELRPWPQKALRTSARWLIDLLLTSVAAWLGSIPLAAYYFHILTPLSGPANVLAVPLCGLVLASDLVSLLLAGWFPFAAEIFNHAGWFLMECIRVTSQWSANWPAAYFYVPTPGLFTVGLYYLILLAVLTGWLFQAGAWRRWKIAGLFALTLAWCAQWAWSGSATRLTVLPLSGGHAVFVNAPGRQNDWLIDSGNKSSVERVMTPFLRAQGVNRLPHFILTHGEISYTGGAQLVEELFRPRNIYSSTVRFRSPEYRKFQAEPAGNLSERNSLKRGDQIGPWTVLHPDAKDRFPKAGDNALVLRGEIGGARVLLLSDLGRLGQDALLERAPDLRADVVVSGLPADGEPLNDALLAAIQPRVIVIADADYPATKRANKALQERLARSGVPVIYTRVAEAVMLEARRNSWELRAMDGTKLKFTPVP